MRLTEVYGAADVLQQAGQLGGLQVGKGCLVLGYPLVQVSQFALDGLLYSPLPRLQLGVFRVPVEIIQQYVPPHSESLQDLYPPVLHLLNIER